MRPTPFRVSAHPSLWLGLALFALSASATMAEEPSFALPCGEQALYFSRQDGAWLGLARPGLAPGLLHSDRAGLWQADFAAVPGAKEDLPPNIAAADKAEFSAQELPAERRLVFTYRQPNLECVVTIQAGDGYADFTAEIKNQDSRPLVDFYLPAKLRFRPDDIERVVAPASGNSGVGFAFLADFFKRQSPDQPNVWSQQRRVESKPYEQLFGGPLAERPFRDVAVSLTVTESGRQWLPAALAESLAKLQIPVNRAPAPGQAELVLVDSPHGPFFAASRLGGTGALWRFGSFQRYGLGDNLLFADTVLATLEHLAEKSAAGGRRKIALLDLAGGPAKGGGTQVPVEEWRRRLRELAVRRPQLELVSLPGPAETLSALAATDYLAIVNPYGEWLPVAAEVGYPPLIAALKQYVQAGGNWFETAGYSFYYELRPAEYLKCETKFPAGFADFLQLDAPAGRLALYSVQPQDAAPWTGAQDRTKLLIPGWVACGGEPEGGYLDRKFTTYVRPGETWRSPAVRLRLGGEAPANLRAYGADNALTRKLAAKLPPALLEKFKSAVLIRYDGSCRMMRENLPALSRPSLLHFTFYLRGGFDKQYPDHLPPPAKFGTPEEFAAFLRDCREAGHLTMPYTNPTWWCDQPRGPTFVREGEAPLLRNADGSLHPEVYGIHKNSGYTICMWHPAVRQANQTTLRQFTQEFPVDLIFQDQCGMRGNVYDFNPASPAPYAYVSGLVSQVAEDCRSAPLSTEGGGMHLLNHETQFCGFSFSLVPTEWRMPGYPLYSEIYPTATWRIFPLAQYLGHDKVAFLYHDLGAFVTNQEVLSWTLGLGFGLSYHNRPFNFAKPEVKGWVAWLAELQRAVVARYVGEPVVAFDHQREAGVSTGRIQAAYGAVTIAANLDPAPCAIAGRALPPFGFFAQAEGLTAGHLARFAGRDLAAPASFVCEASAQTVKLALYAVPGAAAAVELPAGVTGQFRTARLATGETVPCETTAGAVFLTLPTAKSADTASCPQLWRVSLEP